jgi:predicted transcriptional regulator
LIEYTRTARRHVKDLLAHYNKMQRSETIHTRARFNSRSGESAGVPPEQVRGTCQPRLWQIGVARAMLYAMDTGNALPDTSDSVETESERQQRIALEAKLIAEADAEVAAGLCVDSAEVKAWIDTIGTRRESPPPSPRG